ncbi:MAG TPA: hypothetical protein VMZ29_11695 [Candidatus Bathyarchaeia archaeon]|nr:hypothetical protein [Candidatus Bathyarchaeia archaeon]
MIEYRDIFWGLCDLSERELVYYIISIVIGIVGIIGATTVYLLAKRKLREVKSDEEIISLKVTFKEKMKNKLNLSLAIIYVIIMIFTVTALPFIVYPNDLADAWIQIGLFGLLGLGTPFTVILLIIIFNQEVKEMKDVYSPKPFFSWFNFGLLILGLSLPLVCLALITLFRKELNWWKKTLLIIFLFGVLIMWIYLSIWSAKA